MWIYALIIILILVSIALYYIFSVDDSSKQKQTTTKSKQSSSTNKDYRVANGEQMRKAKRKGELGEYKINLQLAQLSKDFKYIDDILIRTNRGLTQIDHVLITPVGLFVIETKNFMGKIYGKPTYKSWIQYINGSKSYFYSPIKQNEGHIKALKAVLKSFGNIDYHSIISFTKRCELRIDLDLRTPQSEPMVVYDTNLSDSLLKKYCLLQEPKEKHLLSIDEIERIHDIISKSNITDPAIRLEHIQGIKKKKLG